MWIYDCRRQHHYYNVCSLNRLKFQEFWMTYSVSLVYGTHEFIRDSVCKYERECACKTRVHDTQNERQKNTDTKQNCCALPCFFSLRLAHTFAGIFRPMQRRNYYYMKMTSLYSSMDLSVYRGIRIWADCHYVSQ